MASHEAVLATVSPLTSRFRVIAPDLRGSGRSHFGGSLTFDQLADDIGALLDTIGIERAIIGGVSAGSGVALRFALRQPARARGLVLIHPPYAGEERGYTTQQQAMFAAMDGMASRAVEEGVQVLRPLYARLPLQTRERAVAMLDTYDPASIAASSRFIASGAQPFMSPADLQRLAMPVLLVRGDDAVHPPEVSDLYTANMVNCTVVPAQSPEIAGELVRFCEALLRDSRDEQESR
jgi:pimeloyl-ACP methyl ester carboxylesterase